MKNQEIPEVGAAEAPLVLLQSCLYLAGSRKEELGVLPDRLVPPS